MKNRNKVFVIIVLLSVGIISISAVWGYNQVSQRKNDYIEYTQAKASVKSEEDVKNAIKKLDEIENKYGESDLIKVDKASLYLNVGDTKNAQKEIESAIKINKLIEHNASFMLVYAQTALENKDIEKVREIIDKVKDLELSEDDKKTLKEIEKSIK